MGNKIKGITTAFQEMGAEARARQARIVEMKTSGMTFAEIAKELEVSIAFVHKRYKSAMNLVVVEHVDTLRKIEIARLDKLHAEATRILTKSHPLVQQGRVVMVPLLDDFGCPVIDEAGGNPVMVPMEDVAPKLNAMSKILSIMERRAKFLGLDAPTKTAFTDPSGENEAAAVVQFYIPGNNRDVPQLEELPPPQT